MAGAIDGNARPRQFPCAFADPPRQRNAGRWRLWRWALGGRAAYKEGEERAGHESPWRLRREGEQVREWRRAVEWL
jgi:hypothetical protein